VKNRKTCANCRFFQAFHTSDSAIAYGDGAYAWADGGTGDSAFADGTNALAVAGGDIDDTGANSDTAIDIGNNDLPSTGYYDGAWAGNADLIGNTSGGTGSNDTAIDIGNNTNDTTLGAGGNEGSFSGAGGLIGSSGHGNYDTAINFDVATVFDPTGADGSYADAGGLGTTAGDYDFAGAFGDDFNALAQGADYLFTVLPTLF
jgi:hypothetical protein